MSLSSSGPLRARKRQRDRALVEKFTTQLTNPNPNPNLILSSPPNPPNPNSNRNPNFLTLKSLGGELLHQSQEMVLTYNFLSTLVRQRALQNWVLTLHFSILLTLLYHG